MNPAYPFGLGSEDARIRGSAVEAVGKFYGVRMMKKAEKEENEAKSRMERLRSKGEDGRFMPARWNGEERAVFGDMVADWVAESDDDDDDRHDDGDDDDEEGAWSEEGVGAPEQRGGYGEFAGVDKGKQPAVGGGAAFEKQALATAIAAATTGHRASTKPAATQQKKKVRQPHTHPCSNPKQVLTLHQSQPAKPEPRGTAWYLERGKELDSKRIG